MASDRLSQAYLEKAMIRIKALKFLHQESGYSDVIHEAQECVELILKATLRMVGVEVPQAHDVSHLLVDKKQLFPLVFQKHLDEIANISRVLRKERDLTFYGSEDWIPTEEYSAMDSQEAIRQTERVYNAVMAAFRVTD